MGLPPGMSFPLPDASADEPTRLAGASWMQITRLFLSQQTRRDEVAADLGLHPSDLIALFHLQDDVGVAQRSLAEHWACDPSWVTTRIDRLEELRYVERRVSATDRRVKEVWLTPEGAAVREAGLAGFAAPPAVLTDLPIEHLRAMTSALTLLDLPDPTQVGMP